MDLRPNGANTDDPTNHLAVALISEYQADDAGPYGPTQLASYTVVSKAELTSTNTWENMPRLSGNAYSIKMSRSGKLLAAATGTGVQLFHFNGASPITEFTQIIWTSGYVSQMELDTSNHLYAVDGESGLLHVYAITTTSAEEISRSPYTIPGGGALGVRVVSP